MSLSRRKFLRRAGHLLGGVALTGVGVRLFSRPSEDAEFIPQPRRFAWQIDPAKCLYCGECERACVRRPSAVKAVNDQTRCSNCVVCYGHIRNLNIESALIDTEGDRICPHDAVTRKNFCGGIDGMFLYGHDHAGCTGCARCVKECNTRGSKSMFLVIRPDLCLGCNECAIAAACPNSAVERIPRNSVTDVLTHPGMDEWEWVEEEA